MGMIGIQPHFGPGDPAYVVELAGVIRTSAPLMERTGVATAEEIGVETFAQRVRDELQTHSAVGAYPILPSRRVGNNRRWVTLAAISHGHPARNRCWTLPRLSPAVRPAPACLHASWRPVVMR
jgi:hypothetical protein